MYMGRVQLLISALVILDGAEVLATKVWYIHLVAT